MDSCSSSSENDCCIKSRLISPETYMKIINHERRQDILHALHKRTLDGPTTKKELSREVGVEYSKVNYQLNNHLSDFWGTVKTEKVRGTIREYIAPENPNSIYINIGQSQLIFNVDPLANLYGKIGVVGTRCGFCSEKQRESCRDEIKSQKCFTDSDSRMEVMEVLSRNNRRKPYTPIDYIIVCEISKIIEGGNCVVRIKNGGCEFLKRFS